MNPPSASPFREPQPPPAARVTHATPRWLYAQVLVAIALGVLVGWLAPGFAVKLKFLGDAFVRLIRMVIAPIVFATVVVGIAGTRDLKRAGRVGLKALLYFEAVTTVALGIGLVVVNVVRPGAGIHANPASLDASAIQGDVAAAHHLGAVDFVLGAIPTSVVDAFAKGEVLQVLVFSVLFGVALGRMGEPARPLVDWIERLSHALFGVVALIMRAAPIGAFGAMAFTIGRYGPHALANLGRLMAAFYATALLFVVVVLGGIARAAGISLWGLVRYLRDELLVVLGTSSSESVLPRVMEKLEELGCSRDVVGLVVPTGYSFNLDGTAIYLTMASIFVAQATDTPLDLGHQLAILGVLLLTSKGAAGVTGSGFITLAATLASTGSIPVAGITLLLGVDRFMSECRALTNLVGNAVATVVVARSEKALDLERAREVLGRGRA